MENSISLENLSPKHKSFGDNILWSYACWQMFWATYTWGQESFTRKSYMLRAKAFKAYKEGKWHIHDLFANNLAKIQSGDYCWYCGKHLPKDKLTKDHVFPRVHGGEDSIDNIIFVCKSCNSSKGKTDLVEWFFRRGEMPHWYLIGHYLKQVYLYAVENELMDKDFEEACKQDLPFNPHSMLLFQDLSYLGKYLKELLQNGEDLIDIMPTEKLKQN